MQQQRTWAGPRRWSAGWVIGLLLVGAFATVPAPAVAADDAPGFGTVELIDDGLGDRWIVGGDGDSWSYVPSGAPCPASGDAIGDGLALRAGADSCAPADGRMTASLDGLVVTGDAPTMDLLGRQQMACAPLDRCELEFEHTVQGRGVASGDDELSDWVASTAISNTSSAGGVSYSTADEVSDSGALHPDGYYHLSYELHRLVVEDAADEASVVWQFVDHATFTDAVVVGAHPERMVPSGVEPGTSTVSLVSADGWGPGAEVTVSGAGVTVEDVEYLGFDEPLQLTLAVDPGAPTGPRDVTIAYPNTPITRTCDECLAIVAPPPPPPPPNGAPDADLTGPATALRGQRVTFDASGSTDPEGRDLSHAWDVDGDGLYDDGEGAMLTTALSELGAHSVAVRVRDPRGVSDTAEATLDVLSLDQAVALRCDGVDGLAYPDGDADVSCLSGLGLVEGFRDGTYRPDRFLTRGEASGLLDRWVTELTGAPLPDAAAAWPDVDGGVFEPAIGRLTAAGVVHGFVDGTFRPGSALTRGQFATLLDRAVTLAMGAPLPSDGDGATGGAHAPAIARLVAANVLASDAFADDHVTAPVDRDLAATVLLRALVAVAYRDVPAVG